MKLEEITMKKGYIGWLLNDEDRARLLTVFKPKYEKVVAHHVTSKFGVTDETPLPNDGMYDVVGYADSNDGLEALVIAIDGNTKRDDGSIYHITWSLNSNYKPKDSNTLVQKGYKKITPININMEPKFFPFK